MSREHLESAEIHWLSRYPLAWSKHLGISSREKSCVYLVSNAMVPKIHLGHDEQQHFHSGSLENSVGTWLLESHHRQEVMLYWSLYHKKLCALSDLKGHVLGKAVLSLDREMVKAKQRKWETKAKHTQFFK